ncbi:hypothetical protein MN608_00651 [Microdochium nivale]|nr:hypothetical protein MN608_00651 [Microdochium nivale]
MSAKLFHENLLANLNTSLSSSSPLSANTVSQLPLKDHVLDLSAHPLTKENFVPNLHDITKIPITPGFMVKTAWKELKPPRKQQADHPASTETTTSSSSSSPRAPSPGCASWAPIVADSYKTHNLRSNPLDGPALDRVLALCRAGHEGGSVTLTALINALCLSSLAPLLPASGSFEAGTAINFRRFLRSAPPGYPSFEPGRTMANYITVMGHKFGPQVVSEVRETDTTTTSTTTKPTTTTTTTSTTTTSTSTAADDSAGAHASAAATITTSDAAKRTTWKAAAQYKHALDARMRRGTKNDATGLMALIGDWRAQHTANTRKPRHAAWNLSNLGVIDGGNSGTDGAESWAVTRSWFCMGAMVCGGAFMISPVAVKGHGLFIGCSWQDGVVDRELAESFFARLDGRLREMAAQA